MSPRKLRLVTILSIPLVAALTMLSVTQPWWTLDVADRSIEVLGTDASPALSALALSSFALTAALALAGPVFRVVLGALQTLIGFTVLFAAITSITDPVRASSALITDATGVAGARSLAELVDTVNLTAWPTVAVVSGALALLIGVFMLITVRRWPAATQKYQAVRLDNADGSADAPRDPARDWDALSDGSDPTDR